MFEENLIRGLGIILCIITILLLAYIMFFKGKGLLVDVTVHWLLLFGFVVLAPLAYLLSFAMGFEGSKTVEFCNSCHVMEDHVQDLKDEDSEYLAAMHYKYRWIAENQCYQCHTDYGLFGGVGAKMDGLRHVWSYYVVGYEIPLKTRGTYKNPICLRCHGPVKAYQETEEHEDDLNDLELSKKSCLGSDCHASTHPKKEKEPEGDPRGE